MRPIELGKDGDVSEPLLDNEVLFALTPEDVTRIVAGLDARGLMIARDILMRSHSSFRRIPEVKVEELEQTRQLEEAFRSQSDQ